MLEVSARITGTPPTQLASEKFRYHFDLRVVHYVVYIRGNDIGIYAERFDFRRILFENMSYLDVDTVRRHYIVVHIAQNTVSTAAYRAESQ